MSELLKALGSLCETPRPELERVAAALELGALPDASEHAEVFLFQLYPFASVYLGPEGQLGGVARDRIGGFWRALGAEPPTEPDHLAVMLASYAGLVEAEGGAAGERQRQAARHSSRSFLWEHLLSWLPLYLWKTARVGGGFYGRWAALLDATLLAEARRLGPQPELSGHLREAAPLEPPAAGSGAEFVEQLLAPVRCGLILVRDDLRAISRELGLGGRAGERRYALKSLLGQAPAEVLAALSELARESAAAASGFAPPLEQVAGFWSERAAASARLLERAAREAG